jgi:hypothetical protein
MEIVPLRSAKDINLELVELCYAVEFGKLFYEEGLVDLEGYTIEDARKPLSPASMLKIIEYIHNSDAINYVSSTQQAFSTFEEAHLQLGRDNLYSKNIFSAFEVLINAKTVTEAAFAIKLLNNLEAELKDFQYLPRESTVNLIKNHYVNYLIVRALA